MSAPRLFQQPIDIDQRQVPVALIVPPPENTAVMPGLEHQPIAQSVLLKETGDPTRPFQIVDGHRRIASAIRYGITSVPALITDGSRGQVAALGAILNASRSPNYVDEARNWKTALEEGQFASVKELAADAHVDVREIEARLKMLTLPESILSEVGGLVKEGIAVRMSRLPDEYRTQAIQSALHRITLGERFTAQHLKEASMQRKEDREAVLNTLFDSLQPALVERDPLAELTDEVCRLSQIAGIGLDQLIASLQARAQAWDGNDGAHSEQAFPQTNVPTQTWDAVASEESLDADSLDTLFGVAAESAEDTTGLDALAEHHFTDDLSNDALSVSALEDTGGVLEMLDHSESETAQPTDESAAVDPFDFDTPLPPAPVTSSRGRTKLSSSRAGRSIVGQRHVS